MLAPAFCFEDGIMDNSLKAISKSDDEIVVANYIVMFGGRDLTGSNMPGFKTHGANLDGTRGEYFTPETNIKSAYTQIGVFPVDWEHGQMESQGEPGREAIGYVDWKTAVKDDVGWFVHRVLNRRNMYVAALDEAGLIDNGLIGTSSEADPTRAMVGRNGEIVSWPITKDTLTVTPFDPRMMGENAVKKIEKFKSLYPELAALLPSEKPNQEVIEMSETKEQVQQPAAVDMTPVLDAIKGIGEQVKAFDGRLSAIENTPDNDPGVAAKGVTIMTDTSHWKYDNLGAGELAMVITSMQSAQRSGLTRRGLSDASVKALAMRLESDERKTDEGYGEALGLMRKAVGNVKANELNQSTLTNYGDEWVGVAYGTELWRSIREGTPILERQMRYAVPQPAGAETLYFPLESADPTWYLVNQSSALTSNPGGIVTNTVTASKLGSANQPRTMAKIGARVVYTGEWEEDSVINAVGELRRQLVESGMEMLESLLINGDTATGATTNINDIAGTPAGNEYWLGLNGYRKLALVTNTANARDGGALDENDFLETAKLMGVAGKNAFRKDGVAFIPDAHTYWKALTIPSVKTRDVNSAATVENGELMRIWGYDVLPSYQFHAPSLGAGYELKANTAGKIDQDTAANNTTGSLLAVRFDQWRPGYRRQMTMETTRIPAADATELVALMRFGMIYRDTEAAAISYNLTV
jgi:hypothetical protein